MTRNLWILLNLLLLPFLNIGQDLKFASLDEVFTDYEVVQVNTASIMGELSNRNQSSYQIKFLGWDLELNDSKILDERYQCVTFDGQRTTIHTGNIPRPMKGFTKQGGKVSITFNDNFVQGYINSGMFSYYVEPVTNFEKNADKGLFVVYNVKDIKPGEEKKCGVTEVAKETDRNRNNIGNGERVGLCYFVDYAIATDYSMFAHYGSTVAVQNHNIAVTNDMQTNYDTEFADALQFVITQQFIVTTSNGDPWSNSLDGNVLLTSFRNWGPTGFTSVHDVASLWTRRNFYAIINGVPQNGVIGIAYLNAICTSSRYNILEDFSSNANDKRVLLAHELGHNFNAGHDASNGLIMSASVTNTNTWSATSITAIQNHYTSKAQSNGGCLAPCVLGPPQISFKTSSTSILEYKGTGSTGTCNLPYKSYFIPVEVNKATTNTVTVAVSVVSGSTATINRDFVIVNSTLTFPSGSQTTQQIEVRIIDDAIEESTENFTLQLSITNGNAVLGSNTTHAFTIGDADLVSTTCCSPGDAVAYGSSPGSANLIFWGEWHDSRTRALYLTSHLTNSGITSGYITSIQYLIGQKNSTQPYQNFRVGLANVSGTTLLGMSWINTQQVFTGTISTPQADVWSEIVFDTPFYWDGTSSLYFEFCFDNTSYTENDLLRYTNPGGTGRYIEAFIQDNQSGCSLDASNAISINYGTSYNIQPHFKFTQLKGVKVESTVNASSKTDLKIGEKANFYSANGRIIASIKNIGTIDINCIEAVVETTGTGKLTLPYGGGSYTAKTIRITATPNALYEVTLYYTQAELNTFGTSANKLNILKTQSTLATSTLVNSTLSAPDVSVTNLGPDIAYAYTGVFTGFSRFALTDRKLITGGSVTNGDIVIMGQGNGLVLKNKTGKNFLISTNNSGIVQTAEVTQPGQTASLNSSNMLINNAANYIILRTPSGSYRRLNISDTGVLSTTSTSLPAVRAQVTSGNLQLQENGAAFIIKSPNGQCWRLFVNEASQLKTVNIICP
ncbi:MAG: hypothetical protein IPM42_01605 [Saprospiraceae bacterium]|nr:hypothetical protein [Saprospiraceae bacterium]